MRLQGGFQDTRKNNEDFALTPYIFVVSFTGEIISVYGLGLCWGYYSIYFGLGFNIPKKIPRWWFHSK
jgi:hypothetical protein